MAQAKGKNTEEVREVRVSAWMLVKVALAVALVAFLYLISDILAIVFVSLVLASAIDPMTDRMQKFRIPRILTVLTVYVLIFGLFSLVVILLIPPIVTEVQALAADFPAYMDRITSSYESFKAFSVRTGLFENIKQGIPGLGTAGLSTAEGLLSTLASVFGGVISFVLVVVITLYMVVEDSAIKRMIKKVVPDHSYSRVSAVTSKVQRKIGHWLWSQILLGIIVGSISFFGLWALGIKYALVLALVAGIAELIPYLGPILAAIPAVFLAFTQSWKHALAVLALYIVIQQVENHFLVPKIMQKAVGLNPLVSIVALLIGAKLGGVVGALLAIPVTAALSIVLDDYLKHRRAKVA